MNSVIFYIIAVNEFRKPIFTKGLEAQKVPQKSPVTMTAVCTADPMPEVCWYHNEKEIFGDPAVKTSSDSKEINDNLKECSFTLHIPSGM